MCWMERYAISYTPGDSQAQRTPAKQLDDLRSPLRFLLGRTEIAKELEGLTLTIVNGGYTLSGVPKGMQQTVQSDWDYCGCGGTDYGHEDC